METYLKLNMKIISMNRIVIGVIAFLAIFSVGCQQQSVESSLCETAHNFNEEYEDQGVSETVHKCLDEEENAAYLLQKGSEYEVGKTYYSESGTFIYKYSEDDTGEVNVYDEQNNIIEQGEYSTLTIPKYECNEVNIC